MHCPYCKKPESRVIDSRTADDGTVIRRRRSCPSCGRRFTTQEAVILMVAKRSGVTEAFTRDKIIRGVRRACQGRPVGEDQLAILAQQVEDTIRARGRAEIASHDIGLAILGPLQALDEVAYLRFASVYRGFESLADFESEIALLRAAHGSAAHPRGTGADGMHARHGVVTDGRIAAAAAGMPRQEDGVAPVDGVSDGTAIDTGQDTAQDTAHGVSDGVMRQAANGSRAGGRGSVSRP